MKKYDSDGNLLPRKLDFSFSSAAKRESSQKQSHSVLDSQSLREDQRGEDLNFPDLQLRLGPSPVKSSQASVTEVSIQDVTPPRKPLPHWFDHQLQKIQLGTCRVSKQDPVTSRGKIEAESNYNSPNKQRHCKCKSSKCLKQYCECFASGSYCNGCNCLNCHNNLENETSRQEAITVILGRNPVAFKPKIVDSPMKDLQVSKTCIQQTTNATVKRVIDMSDYLNSPESRKVKSKDASHSEAARGSSVVSPVVHNPRLNHVNNKAVSGSTTCTYRSFPSSTILPHHVREICSLLVVKAADVTEKFSERDPSRDPAQRDVNEINDTPDCIVDANRMDWKSSSPTRVLMCDEEHEIVSEKETSVRVKTSQEKEDGDTSSEIYLEQERRILSCLRDCLIQFSTSGSINARNL